MDIFIFASDMTESIDKHILFDKNLWEDGVRLSTSRRKSFTALMNDLLEKELKESGYLSEHN